MVVYVASARIDENGEAHGGKAGDQNGKEVSSQVWYEHKKGWVLLRCREPDKRKKIAKCMRDAYVNEYIGYDQYQRDTLYDAVKGNKFDVNTLEKLVETDCSALVRVCVCYAGIDCPNFRTTDQAKVITNTGWFDKYTEDKYVKSPDYLLEGDILVTKTQGHTVVVLNDGAKAKEETADVSSEDMITVASGSYFLRRGPGKEYTHDGIYVRGGQKLKKVDIGAWTPVQYNNNGTLETRYIGASGVRKE